MNIFAIAFGSMLVLTFILALLANTSVSQRERQVRVLGTIVTALLAILIIWLFAPDDVVVTLGTYILVAEIWAFLIAFFVNQKTIEQTMGYSKLSWAMFGYAFLMVLISILALIPNRRIFPTGEPVIDSEYLITRLGFLLVCIPGMILYILIAVKKTIFYKDGIFHDGLRWAWSDFESYKWQKENASQKETFLLLETKDLWLNRQIKLRIASDQKDRIDSLLAKEVHS